MRISKEPEERKREIICVARALFEKTGIDGTKISDIVREINVAQGLFYYYFKSKEDIVRAVAMQRAQELELVLDEKISGKNVISRIQGLFECYLDMYQRLNFSPLIKKVDDLALQILESKVILKLRALIDLAVSEGKMLRSNPQETAAMVFYGIQKLVPVSVDAKSGAEIAVNTLCRIQ